MENNYLWNERSLKPPPIITYKNQNGDADFRCIQTIVEDAIDLLKKQSILHKDAAVMTRLHYKLGKKFRCDIGYSYFKRAHVALLKYNNFPILKDLQTFLDVITSNVYIYVPSRQMLDYVLTRLQTFSKLMCRIVVCSRKCGTFYYERIRRGDAWWYSLMPYAVTSRIWYITRHLLKNSCKWYNFLLPYRNKLDEVGVPFVPKDYDFPSNLNDWLDVEWLDQTAGQCWNNSKIYTLLNVDPVEPIVEELNIQLNNNHKEFITYATTNSIIIDDIGESISRDTFHSTVELENTKETKKSKVKKSKHCIDNIKDKKSLVNFIQSEENYREQSSKKAITADMSFMQWQSLKMIVDNLIYKMNTTNEEKILKKIKRTWCERCFNK